MLEIAKMVPRFTKDKDNNDLIEKLEAKMLDDKKSRSKLIKHQDEINMEYDSEEEESKYQNAEDDFQEEINVKSEKEYESSQWRR
jgi:hypothetical protein